MDELLGRRMPYSAEAEQAVLGSCLIDPRCISDLISVLRSEDFYLEQNRDIYDTIYRMFTYSMTIDPVTVLDQMKQGGVFREESTARYLRELMDMTPTSANAMKYAQIVRDQALLRNLITACNEVSEAAAAGGGEAGTVLDLAERKIYALRQGRIIGGLIPASQVVQSVYANLSVLARSGKTVPGVTTGLRDLDRRLMGLNKSDFILVASRPGMGKTSIALNMAMAAAKENRQTVAVFSLEMSREQLVQRLLSAEGRINLGHLITGNLSQEEWRRAAQAAASVSATDIRINDNPNMTVADMNAQCRRLENLGLVVIDYLQLMQSSGSGNSWSGESRTQAVSDISRMLKIMAKELNVPVVCLSQLSRANEQRSDKRPMLSDLRESGSIEQDADIVIGLYREGYYNQECENPNLAEAIVLKNRHGETGKDYLIWQGEYTSYVDAELNRDEYD
ncbi:MAG: replicative DNA helicase [Clostridiales bacterium]|nr:replicative DNA helicase [Candidatus Apopatocola equi]MCQ2439795.1 replicative DNA helicase [Oscillospiraceae bacterium]